MAAWIAVSALLALLGAAADPPASLLASGHVRTQSPEVRALIDGAILRSPTVRDLIARLGCSDLIVYVEVTSSPQIPTARTKLVASVSNVRFVRIGINVMLPDRDRTALLGHELQHAVEIAEHDDVRDDGGVRRLFARIGRSSGGDSYETDAARDVEWTVRSELRTKMGG